MKLLSLIFSLLIIITLNGCKSNTSNYQDSAKNDQLFAFAKLYGDAKYFCPSDEAAAIDWDAFALYGTSRILELKDNSGFIPLIDELFSPIVPELKIYSVAEKDSNDLISQLNYDSSQLTTSWQHFGHGDRSSSRYYKSVRTNRLENTYTKDKAAFSYLISTTRPFVADSVSVIFDIKHIDKSLRTYTTIFLGVKYEDQKNFKYERLDRYFGSEWKKVKIKLALDHPVSEVEIVTSFNDKGTLLIDNIETSIFKESSWYNHDSISFEEKERSFLTKKNTNKQYLEQIKEDDNQSGNFIYSIGLLKNSHESKLLYNMDHKLDKILFGNLNDSMTYKFPTVLVVDSNSTIPKTKKSDLEKLLIQLDSIHAEKYEIQSINAKTANFITLWNVLKHFYPYTKELEIDWDREFHSILGSPDLINFNHKELLQVLVSKLKDGHGRVRGLINYSVVKRLPLKLDLIGNKTLIVDSYVDSLQKYKGSELFSVNDTLLSDYIDYHEKFFSSSNKRNLINRIVGSLTILYDYDSIKLQFITPSGSKWVISNNEYLSSSFYSRLVNKKDNLNKERTFEKGIGYIAFKTLGQKEFEMNMEKLFSNHSIIIDARNTTSRSVKKIIKHFICHADTTKWLYVPKIYNLKTKRNFEYSGFGWNYFNNNACYDGQIYYLTNTKILSYGESVAAYFEKFPNTTVIGQPTAGTNGDINRTYLPGGFTVTWTGTKVLKHDGSQLHGIGIIPDVYVERTQEGIAAGKDEVLEKAIKLAKAYTDSLSNIK